MDAIEKNEKSDEPNQTDHSELKNVAQWQSKLLPWFILMPSLLIVIFLCLATYQMLFFHKTLDPADERIVSTTLSANLPEHVRNDLEYIKWSTLVQLEQESFIRRYNQGGFLLMSRVYTKYLGFITGMILAIVGSVFIIGKIQVNSFALKGELSDRWKVDLITTSPGVIFALLGTTLMVSTIMQHNEIRIRDQPLYLSPAAQLLLSKKTSNDETYSGLVDEIMSDSSKIPNDTCK